MIKGQDELSVSFSQGISLGWNYSCVKQLVWSAPGFGQRSLATWVVVSNSRSSVSMALEYVRSLSSFVGRSRWVEDTEAEVFTSEERKRLRDIDHESALSTCGAEIETLLRFLAVLQQGVVWHMFVTFKITNYDIRQNPHLYLHTCISTCVSLHLYP